MKKIFLAFIAMFLMCGTVSAAMIEEGSAVAVMDFSPHKGTSDADVELMNSEKVVSDYIIQELISTDKFNVIDKEIQSDLLDGLNLVGVINPETAKKIGERLNVRYIIYGNVMSVTIDDKAAVVVNVHTVHARLTARIMDVETGKILMMAKGEGKSDGASLGDESSLIAIGNVKVSQESVHNALMKASFQAVDTLVERLFK